MTRSIEVTSLPTTPQSIMKKNAILFARKKQLLLEAKSRTSARHIARETKICLADAPIETSLIPKVLKKIRDDFLAKANPTPPSIKLIIKEFHRALREKAKKFCAEGGKDLAEIVDAIKPGCDFEKYLLKHIDEKKNVTNAVVIFCNYLMKVIASPNERLEELMAGFPPIEENCVPGSSGRIALLMQSRFVKPQNVTTVSAYNSAIARLSNIVKDSVGDANQTHIPFSIDWQLKLKDEEQLAREDNFYKLPFYEIGARNAILLEINFRQFFLQSVEEDLLAIEKYLGEFSLAAEELNMLNQMLIRYGISVDGAYEEREDDESSSDGEDENPALYHLRSDVAKQLLETVSTTLTTLASTQEYHPLVATEQEFEESLSIETAQKISRALSSTNDDEFLEALRLFALFSQIGPAASKWQMHNICYELFHDPQNPDKFRKEKDDLTAIKARLAAIKNPEDKKVANAWLDKIEPEVKKLEIDCNPNFLHMRRHGEFPAGYIPAASEGVDNGLISVALKRLQPQPDTAGWINILCLLTIGAESNHDTNNKNLRIFVPRQKADILIAELVDKILLDLEQDPQIDQTTRWQFLGLIMSLAAQQNDDQAFKRILEIRSFTSLDLVNGCMELLTYNLGYGYCREVKGSDINKNPDEFITHIVNYLKNNPALLADPEFKKYALKLTNDMLDYAIHLDKPHCFKFILENLVKEGPFEAKDLDVTLLKSIQKFDRVNFIQALKDCGFPKTKFLELTPTFNFLHDVAKEGKSALMAEFLKVFQPSHDEVNQTSAEQNFKVKSFLDDRHITKTPRYTHIATKQHRYTALEIAVYANHPSVIMALKEHIDFSQIFPLSQKWLTFKEADVAKAEDAAPITRLCYKTFGKVECLKALLSIVKERLDMAAADPESFKKNNLTEEYCFGFNLSNTSKKELERLDKMTRSCGKEFHEEFRQTYLKAQKNLKDFQQQLTCMPAQASALQVNTRTMDPAMIY